MENGRDLDPGIFVKGHGTGLGKCESSLPYPHRRERSYREVNLTV
jgi:hypothetical protein